MAETRTNIDMGTGINIRSSYLEYLPTFLENNLVLNGFLLAFEQVLSGLPQEVVKDRLLLQADKVENLGFEQVLDNISAFFEPDTTPDKFLPWLAGWVALSLNDNWYKIDKRKFIRHISYLYRLRGTKAGLEQMLELYVNPNLDLNQDYPLIENIKIDEDFLNPYYFQVEVRLRTRLDELDQQKRIILSIIDKEKPSHTFYALKLTFPTMKIVDSPEGGKEKVWQEKIEPQKEKKIIDDRIEKVGIWVGITTRLGVLATDN